MSRTKKVPSVSFLEIEGYRVRVEKEGRWWLCSDVDKDGKGYCTAAWLRNNGYGDCIKKSWWKHREAWFCNDRGANAYLRCLGLRTPVRDC
jgi:hypothetical protein